ncbi:type II secretion system protein GspM [Trichloromonas sp.]|uniref:type II secretion system protein GspM n=1 Tax=Trichloromonas sp. TaxID=3069249 RepID=UPI003D81A299
MLSQLNQRQRIVLFTGTLFALASLIYFGLVAPYQNALRGLDRKIASRQQQLADMQTLSRQYVQLKQNLNTVQQRLDQDSAFSMFSSVESLAVRDVGRENLVYMRPQPPTEKEGFREESVEIKLERVNLPQLMRLLYDVEAAEMPLQVKSLRVKTRFDDRHRLDSVLTVASYGRTR